MFGNAIAKLPHQCGILRNVCPALTVSQRGHRMRGKPPGVALNIEQRLQSKYKSIEVMSISSHYFSDLIFFQNIKWN